MMRREKRLLVTMAAAVSLMFAAVPCSVFGDETAASSTEGISVVSTVESAESGSTVVPEAEGSDAVTAKTGLTAQNSDETKVGALDTGSEDSEAAQTADPAVSSSGTETVDPAEEESSSEEGTEIESEAEGQEGNETADPAADEDSTTGDDASAETGTENSQTDDVASDSETEDAGSEQDTENTEDTGIASESAEQGDDVQTDAEAADDESSSSESTGYDDEEMRKDILAAEQAYEEALNAAEGDQTAIDAAAKKAADCLEVYIGDESQHRQGIGGGWWYEVSGSRKHFTGLYLDGELMEKGAYRLSDDCAWTIVSLLYFAGFPEPSLGKHTLTFAYTYGSIDATLYVVSDGVQIPPRKPIAPDTSASASPVIYLNTQTKEVFIAPPVQTGDPGIAAYAVELILSLGSIGGISAARAGIRRRKREKKNNRKAFQR